MRKEGACVRTANVRLSADVAAGRVVGRTVPLPLHAACWKPRKRIPGARCLGKMANFHGQVAAMSAMSAMTRVVQRAKAPPGRLATWVVVVTAAENGVQRTERPERRALLRNYCISGLHAGTPVRSKRGGATRRGVTRALRTRNAR